MSAQQRRKPKKNQKPKNGAASARVRLRAFGWNCKKKNKNNNNNWKNSNTFWMNHCGQVIVGCVSVWKEHHFSTFCYSIQRDFDIQNETKRFKKKKSSEESESTNTNTVNVRKTENNQTKRLFYAHLFGSVYVWEAQR